MLELSGKVLMNDQNFHLQRPTPLPVDHREVAASIEALALQAICVFRKLAMPIVDEMVVRELSMRDEAALSLRQMSRLPRYGR